jgi:hypothetical protein
MRHLGDVHALQLHLPPARVIEQPGPVAEQDRRDDRQHLVELAELQALTGDVGTEDVHVPVPGGSTSRCQPAGQVGDERHVRHRACGRVMGQHE